MKYLTETLKYLKSNLLLLPALALAIAACIPMPDTAAIGRIADAIQDGISTATYTDWLLLFLPVNTQDWVMAAVSLVCMIVLALDLAFIHSMVDKHVRFGTKSFRSIFSSLTINFAYALMCVLTLFVFDAIISLVLAAVTTTFASIGTSGIYIVGLVISALLLIVLLYIAGHFFLWLPCVEITGFKVFEALSYSYSLARPRRWKIFVNLLIPVASALCVTVLVAMFADAWTAHIVTPIVYGCAFMLISVSSYMAYAEAEGIEREDLRKY